MISKVFSIYDSKAELYMKPFHMATKGQAIRGFADLANDESTDVGKHPQDFTLFEIGEYDDERGEYTMHTTKTSLGIAIEFKRGENR